MPINVSEVEGDIDYAGAMKEFGIEDISPYLARMKDLPVMYRRGLVIGHRDFGQIYDAMEKKKKFAVLTGANPSGPLHLGHSLFLKQALFFQERGGEVFIPISTDETYVFRKSASLEQAYQTAMEIIPDIIAFGFDPKRTKIFISTNTTHRLYELAVKMSAKTTFSTVKAVFGFTNESSPGQIFYSVMQAAHILFPQLHENGGPRPVVVPIGIDQDPYMRLVRDIAEKVNMVKPSSTYHKFLPGLQGGKMSSSKPDTCIFLNDTPEAARKKIMRAFSGGAVTLAEHREQGGNPDVDIACQYLYYMFEDDDRKIKDIFSAFRSGSLHSRDVKNMLADKVASFLQEHQKKREKAKDIDRFLIK